jgi:hypothetical protein
MMQREPAARYQSHSEVAAALEPFAAGAVAAPSELELPPLDL